MDLISDRGNRVTVEELNTSNLLKHAREQADRFGLRPRCNRCEGHLNVRIVWQIY